MVNSSSNVKNNYTYIAGIAYVLIIILSLIPSNMFNISSILKAEEAAKNIIGYEGVFRIGIAIEFSMFMSVMVLSWALYIILKPVNKNLALLGLIFRFAEAVLGCVVILFYLTILMLLSGAEYLQVFEPAQLQALARFFLQLSGVGFYILLALMGVGAIVYCYLFYISNYIPRILSVWGIITYSTMVAYGFINIIFQNPPRELMYAMAPGALFEITIGLWLVFKGISVNQKQTASTREG